MAMVSVLSDPRHANTGGENGDMARTNDQTWGESAGEEFRTCPYLGQLSQ